MNNQNDMQITMDSKQLYREDIFTDQKVGTIRRMTPVDGDGNPDSDRPVIYSGQAQMMTPAGALPLNFDIPASSLSEACAKFAAEAHIAMEQTIAELKEMRRQQASSIVIPGESPKGPMPGKFRL
jgi:hypothetical protein